MTWLSQPREQSVQRPAVDDAVGGDTRKPRVSEGGVRVGQLIGRMRVAVERKETTRIEGSTGQAVVDILPRRVAVNLDGHRFVGGNSKHGTPVRHHTGARAGDSTAWMGQDPNSRVLDGRDQAVGLIVILTEL